MKKYGFISLILLITGCTPCCYRSKPIELCCTDLQENVCDAFETTSVCEGYYPNEAWWTFFQDPQLNNLIELSLANHPDIKLAEARILRAQEEAIETRSALLPHFFLYGDLTREKLSQFASRTLGATGLQYITEATSYLTSASYELDIWNKNRNRFYASLDEVCAQIADYEEAKLLLSTTIASVYFDLQYNLELLKIAKRRLQAREELYALLRQRFDNGVISQFHLYETDTEVQAIKDLIFQQEGMIEVDRHALAALIGNVTCGFGELCKEPSALFKTPLPLPPALPIDLLARRPDVTAAKLRVEASCFDVKVARANFFPKIDLLGYIGFTSFKLAEFFTKRALEWIGDAVGLLPLYTGQQLEAKLGIAREDLEIAIEEYNQTVLNAIQQVSDALTELVTADKRLSALSQSVEDAVALYNLTDQRFQNGVDNQISVLNGLENVLVQEELETVVQLDRFQAAVALIRAIGGGYYDCSCE